MGEHGDKFAENIRKTMTDMPIADRPMRHHRHVRSGRSIRNSPIVNRIRLLLSARAGKHTSKR